MIKGSIYIHNATPEKILVAIREGMHVCCDRQTGKTTALLMYLHEIRPAKLWIRVPSERARQYTLKLWEHLYPGEEPPIILTQQRSYGMPPGICDELALCSGSHRANDWVREMYIAAVC